MAPLTPHWQQPSHPAIQEIIIVNEAEFTTKSLSRVALPPFALFARFDFPPCTEAPEPTYATVQMGRNRHLNLNSDLLYINHSCEPSLVSECRSRLLASPVSPACQLTHVGNEHTPKRPWISPMRVEVPELTKINHSRSLTLVTRLSLLDPRASNLAMNSLLVDPTIPRQAATWQMHGKKTKQPLITNSRPCSVLLSLYRMGNGPALPVPLRHAHLPGHH